VADDQLLDAAVGRLDGLAELLQTLARQPPHQVTGKLQLTNEQPQPQLHVLARIVLSSTHPAYLDCELVHEQGL